MPRKCLDGKLDAGLYHGKTTGHFILGVLFGPFAILGTLAIANPTPEKSKTTMKKSKNKELFSDPEYLKCYKKEAKGNLIVAEGLGWGAWVVFVLLISI